MDYIKNNISELGLIVAGVSLIVAICAAFIAFMQLSHQKKTINNKHSLIRSNIAGQERSWINETGATVEEVAIIKFINAGLAPDAVESARFEVFVGDETGKWDLMDVIGADKEFQIAMPLRLDPAGFTEVRFTMNSKRAAAIRENRVIFVQNFMRHEGEIRKEFVVRHDVFTFPDDGAET